jgi:hypothetical protein
MFGIPRLPVAHIRDSPASRGLSQPAIAPRDLPRHPATFPIGLAATDLSPNQFTVRLIEHRIRYDKHIKLEKAHIKIMMIEGGVSYENSRICDFVLHTVHCDEDVGDSRCQF